jgi:hypothetical protein
MFSKAEWVVLSTIAALFGAGAIYLLYAIASNLAR